MIAAAKRWLAANAERYHTGNDTLLGDDLYAHQPFCRQVLLHGFHLEHNFGHGKAHLSSLLATMNLLAFGLHTLLEFTDGNYRLVRSAVGARRKFFEHIRTLTTYLHFESWDHLMDFLLRGLEIGPYASLRN